MVKTLHIGVLGVQGAVSEHVVSLRNTLKEKKVKGRVFVVNHKNEIDKINALIIPGGECTTISKVLQKADLYHVICTRIKDSSLPIMGTCAGCVILAKEITNNTRGLKLLNAMNILVERNVFGRQKESFEKYLAIKGFSSPYKAVFIRAPIIKKVWGKCEVLAKIDKKIVMAKQGNLLALSFHPELTDDLRIHKYFLDMILEYNK